MSSLTPKRTLWEHTIAHQDFCLKETLVHKDRIMSILTHHPVFNGHSIIAITNRIDQHLKDQGI